MNNNDAYDNNSSNNNDTDDLNNSNGASRRQFKIRVMSKSNQILKFWRWKSIIKFMTWPWLQDAIRIIWQVCWIYKMDQLIATASEMKTLFKMLI